MIKKIIFQITPPIIINIYRKLKTDAYITRQVYKPESSDEQELDIYWSEDMASQLETWGRNHTWNEIECLLANCKGKVLDIACGTGVNMIDLSRFQNLDVYGFDISDFLIKKALAKGIDSTKLKVEDATKTSYLDDEFDYSYSIGSLEHFTEEGIDLFLKECSRYTKNSAFHMIPVSESDKDEGWLRSNQSFHNNSVSWWLAKYGKYFREVHVITSGYKDVGLSVGKWFICNK